jgi:hypothetical protein
MRRRAPPPRRLRPNPIRRQLSPPAPLPPDPCSARAPRPATIPIGARLACGLVTVDAVWAATDDGVLHRIDPATNEIAATIPDPSLTYRFDIGHNAAWSPTSTTASCARIDLDTARSSPTSSPAPTPRALTAPTTPSGRRSPRRHRHPHRSRDQPRGRQNRGRSCGSDRTQGIVADGDPVRTGVSQPRQTSSALTSPPTGSCPHSGHRSARLRALPPSALHAVIIVLVDHRGLDPTAPRRRTEKHAEIAGPSTSALPLRRICDQPVRPWRAGHLRLRTNQEQRHVESPHTHLPR